MLTTISGNSAKKISGMVTEASLDSWKYEDFVPYMKVVCEAFGNAIDCYQLKLDN